MQLLGKSSTQKQKLPEPAIHRYKHIPPQAHPQTALTNTDTYTSHTYGFQTLLVLMILFAGQQKGHPSCWHGLPLRRGCSSWVVRVQE